MLFVRIVLDFIFFWFDLNNSFEDAHTLNSWVLSTLIFFGFFLEHAEKTFFQTSCLTSDKLKWIKRRSFWKNVFDIFKFIIEIFSVVFSFSILILIPSQRHVEFLRRRIDFNMYFKSFMEFILWLNDITSSLISKLIHLLLSPYSIIFNDSLFQLICLLNFLQDCFLRHSIFFRRLSFIHRTS